MSKPTAEAEIQLPELPLGDWAGLKRVEAGEGLMATRFGATLARAVHVRSGGTPAFLKILPCATDSAGPQTQDALAADRLRRLEQRLKSVASEGERIPVVRMLEVRLAEGEEYLLIAMERLEMLQSRLERGQACLSLAIRLLKRLAPEDASWVHFDVCPRNIGVDDTGVPWLIDPDSVFLLDDGGVRASGLFCKPFRAVQSVFRRVVESQRSGDFDIEILRVRQAMEVAIAAAECALGQEAAIPSRQHHVDEWLPSWLESARRGAPDLVAVFESHITPAIAACSRVDLNALAIALENFKRSAAASQPAQSSREMANEEPVQGDTDTDVVDVATSSWAAMAPHARRLRADRMGALELADYVGRLESLLSEDPACEEAWLEMMYTQLCFMGDAAGAAETLDRATDALPESAVLRHWRNVLTPQGGR